MSAGRISQVIHALERRVGVPLFDDRHFCATEV
ncbi:LysR family transcriptional regulator [Streptomyces smyrnaeus]